MGDRVFIDTAWDGTTEFAHFDSDGNLEALEWTNDVGVILDNNKALQNDGSGGYGKSREWKHLAEIPMTLVRVWEREAGVPVDFFLSKEGFPALLAKIKDIDYRHLRTDK